MVKGIRRSPQKSGHRHPGTRPRLQGPQEPRNRRRESEPFPLRARKLGNPHARRRRPLQDGKQALAATPRHPLHHQRVLQVPLHLPQVEARRDSRPLALPARLHRARSREALPHPARAELPRRRTPAHPQKEMGEAVPQIRHRPGAGGIRELELYRGQNQGAPQRGRGMEPVRHDTGRGKPPPRSCRRRGIRYPF